MKIGLVGFNIFEFESDIINIEPFLKKAQVLKKILLKFSNKTYTMNDKNNYQDFNDNFEIDVKIEICHLFNYILDI